MDIPDAMAAELAGLADPTADLPGLLTALHDALLMAVPSGLGLSITLRAWPTDITLSTLQDSAVPATSLLVPLDSFATVDSGGVVVFYAGSAGALVDLAADLGWVLDLPVTWSNQMPSNSLILDQHLMPDRVVRPVQGLQEMSTVHQAIGALVGGGRTPEEALHELRQAADTRRLTVAAAAERLIGNLTTSTLTATAVDLAEFRSGIAWVGVAQPGDHLCGLYRGLDQRDALLLPYLQSGLLAGDRCLCLIDQTEPDELRQQMAERMADHTTIGSGHLEISRADDIYRRSGHFDPDDMIEFLADSMSAVEAAGTHRQFRAAGEMSWIKRNRSGTDEFFGYESAVNRLAPEHPTVLMCLYDLDNLDEATLINVLRTHPKVLYDNQVAPNPHYLTPDEYSRIA